MEVVYPSAKWLSRWIQGRGSFPVPNFDQLRRFDIGARKVLSDEEQRLATQSGGGVAETIAEIEAGRVTASPESEKCLTRLTPVTRAEGNHLNLERLQKALEHTVRIDTNFGGEHDAGFGQRRSTHHPDLCGKEARYQ